MGALYRIQFPNGKSYIGITMKTAAERFARHCANLFDQDKADLALVRAMKKYGADRAVLTTLAICDDWGALCLMESRAIVAYGTKFPRGYNLTDGGEGLQGVVVDDGVRIRMANSARAAWAVPGHREKMSALRTGKKQKESTKQKRSASVAAAWADPEYKARLGAAHKAAWVIRRAKTQKEIE